MKPTDKIDKAYSCYEKTVSLIKSHVKTISEREKITDQLLDRYEQVLFDMDDEKLEEEYMNKYLAEGLRERK